MMSPEAITARLREMADLSDLCWRLQSLDPAETMGTSDQR